jgi:hypothetical protein
MAIWYNLWLFGIVCGHLLYIFPNLECLDQEKSGNPGPFGSFKAQKPVSAFDIVVYAQDLARPFRSFKNGGCVAMSVSEMSAAKMST